MYIEREQLRCIPYLDVDAVGDRSVNVMQFWDGSGWHVWVPGPDGPLHMKPLGSYRGDYVAQSAADEGDLHIPFVELMWQRASWPEVCPLIDAISADFHNLGTAVEKLDHFFWHRKDFGIFVGDLVKTELEYIFMLSRSVFDLLQEVIQRIWGKRIRLLDANADAKRKARGLPPTFSKMVLVEKGPPRTSDELVDKYALSRSLANAYVAAAPFFAQIRQARDAIVHSGKDSGTVFATERAFCVLKGAPEFANLSIWTAEHEDNPNLVSLLPLVAYVTLGTIETCNSLVNAVFAEIIPRPEIAPGYRVFVRGPHNHALLWMLDVASGGSPWWPERDRPRRSRVQEHAYHLWETRNGEAWWDPASNWLQAERELRRYRPIRQPRRAE